jgi:hypothetical protein
MIIVFHIKILLYSLSENVKKKNYNFREQNLNAVPARQSASAIERGMGAFKALRIRFRFSDSKETRHGKGM